MKTNVPETEGLYVWEVREKASHKLVDVVETHSQFERGWGNDYTKYILIPIKYAGITNNEE